MNFEDLKIARMALVLCACSSVPALITWLLVGHELGSERIPVAEFSVPSKEILAHARIMWVDPRPKNSTLSPSRPDAVRLSFDSWEADFAAFVTRYDPSMVVVINGQYGGSTAQAVADRLRGETGISSIFVYDGAIPSASVQR